jgi:hypothetical protein
MMYAQLYQYLLQHKQLPVPGIGTFLLERKSAEIDFFNKKIDPPAYAFALDSGSHLPGQDFFKWLANALGVSDREAIFRFNDFAFEMKKQIGEGHVINWNGIGTLNKGLGGDVKLTPSAIEMVFEKPVIAEKVIRNKAEHMVRVGEDERTSVEMTEMLNQKEEKKSQWWIYALAVALLSIMFLGWYFSEHGVDISSAANGQVLIPQEAGTSYQILP